VAGSQRLYEASRPADLRRPVPYMWPAKSNDPEFPQPKPGEPQRWPWTGRLCGDHGSPIWEPMHFYHNTVIWRDRKLAFFDYRWTTVTAVGVR
jgi:hypothetical protein